MVKSAVLLSLALAPAAQAGELSCDIDSDYDLRRHGKAFVFERQDGDGPKNLALGGGRIWVDGVEAKLSAAGHAHMREFEGELNRLPPQVQEVATEAMVGSFVEPLVAELVGNAVASSLKVAFSFDEAKLDEFEQRMERMGEEIEARVEKRADALCVRAKRLDRIECALDYRLADGGYSIPSIFR